MFKVPEKYRMTSGVTGTTSAFGNNGQFLINGLKFKKALFVQASDGGGWEHVSVSTSSRCPTWEEMSNVKSLFWDDSDVVIQIHPRKKNYVNIHDFCLHLWRSFDRDDYCELPPDEFV